MLRIPRTEIHAHTAVYTPKQVDTKLGAHYHKCIINLEYKIMKRVVFQVRLPADIHAAVVQSADLEHRSMNGQVAELLALGLKVKAEQAKLAKAGAA